MDAIAAEAEGCPCDQGPPQPAMPRWLLFVCICICLPRGKDNTSVHSLSGAMRGWDTVMFQLRCVNINDILSHTEIQIQIQYFCHKITFTHSHVSNQMRRPSAGLPHTDTLQEWLLSEITWNVAYVRCLSRNFSHVISTTHTLLDAGTGYVDWVEASFQTLMRSLFLHGKCKRWSTVGKPVCASLT
jgi:hypothetical protein